MGVFYLKYKDTRPVLEVALKNPDGTPYDLTGSTDWKLHIRLNTGVVVTRDMTKVGADQEGRLRYTWLATDWDQPGGLVVGPTLPLQPTDVEHAMEYEVIGPTSRQTFPGGGYDTLRIQPDLGQG